jgi:hypothetical protein
LIGGLECWKARGLAYRLVFRIECDDASIETALDQIVENRMADLSRIGAGAKDCN